MTCSQSPDDTVHLSGVLGQDSVVLQPYPLTQLYVVVMLWLHSS
jgi:hypothetical protein